MNIVIVCTVYWVLLQPLHNHYWEEIPLRKNGRTECREGQVWPEGEMAQDYWNSGHQEGASGWELPLPCIGLPDIWWRRGPPDGQSCHYRSNCQGRSRFRDPAIHWAGARLEVHPAHQYATVFSAGTEVEIFTAAQILQMDIIHLHIWASHFTRPGQTLLG